MDEFPSNSKRLKEVTPPEKKIERIATGAVVRRKKPLGRRFAENFGGEDGQSVGMYILLDVLIPAIKDMLADATTTGVERILYGDSRRSGPRSGRPPGYGSPGRVPYNGFSSGPGNRSSSVSASRPPGRQSRSTHNFDEIILDKRVEAEEVLGELDRQVNSYNAATVADLYDAVGIQPEYTDNKWGWTDLRGARVERVRNGYLLNLPKPEPLE